MSAVAEPASRRTDGRLTVALRAGVVSSWLGVLIAAAIAAICFGASGGTSLPSATATEIPLTLGSASLVAAACLRGAGTRRLWGAGCLVAMLALAVFTSLSTSWSVAPSLSLVESNRTFAYTATFAGAIALARLAPGRWRSVLAGVLVGSTVVSAYAVAAKIFPATLDPGETYARLREPFDYWNAVGLTAALGVPPCLWLGARREGDDRLNAVAAPILCLLIVTVLLSYSRGALLALALGLGFWFAATPLRLRALATLALAIAGSVPVLAWAFAQPSLTQSNVALAQRTWGGHRLGVLLILALLATLLVALPTRFATLRNPPSQSTRRRVAAVLLVALALVPIGAIGALSASSRGLGGSISHAWVSLTNSRNDVPSSGPNRLTASGNDHALYWNLALKVFDANPITGTGAGSYQIATARYRTSQATAINAHGYVVQTLSDLGLVGLFISLILAAAWLMAAIRSANPFGWASRAGPAATAATRGEQAGLLTLIACVIVFVVHSGVDWTWFVPGDAVIALLCAGWVAGRGPHRDVPSPTSSSPRRGTRAPLAVAAASATVAIALVLAWTQWQPLRATNAITASLAASFAGHTATALRDAQQAISDDPLDLQAQVAREIAQSAAGDVEAARATITRAVTLEPSNAASWEALAQFDLTYGDRAGALSALRSALFLDPQSEPTQTAYLTTVAEGSTSGAHRRTRTPTTPASRSH